MTYLNLEMRERLNRRGDNEEFSTPEAAFYINMSTKGLLGRIKRGAPPPCVEGKGGGKGNSYYFLKRHLDIYKDDRDTPLHVYTFADGRITAHGSLSDPLAVVGTIADLLAMEWADAGLMQEALAIFKTEQEQAYVSMQQRVSAASDREALNSAIGNLGNDQKP